MLFFLRKIIERSFRPNENNGNGFHGSKNYENNNPFFDLNANMNLANLNQNNNIKDFTNMNSNLYTNTNPNSHFNNNFLTNENNSSYFLQNCGFYIKKNKKSLVKIKISIIIKNIAGFSLLMLF